MPTLRNRTLTMLIKDMRVEDLHTLNMLLEGAKDKCLTNTTMGSFLNFVTAPGFDQLAFRLTGLNIGTGLEILVTFFPNRNGHYALTPALGDLSGPDLGISLPLWKRDPCSNGMDVPMKKLEFCKLFLSRHAEEF